MTDYTELKRLAEACGDLNWRAIQENWCEWAIRDDHGYIATMRTKSAKHTGPCPDRESKAKFLCAVTPAAVLALIAENERLNAENKQLIVLECHGGIAEAAINLLAENEALRDHLRLRVSAMPRDRLRETFNAADYGPRELGSDGEQCRAGVLAVIDAAMGKGERS